MASKRKKLVLAVIDSLKPEMLDRAVAEGRAPALAALLERGVHIPDCVSTFPSVTPVATSTIATGAGPDRHHVPSINWFHRGESRYVEYGSSFQAARTFGVLRSLNDTVYNLNMAHLSRGVETLFERLEDAGLRTAGTTWLIYRGRTRHEIVTDGLYGRLARAGGFRHAVWGPTELFYADLYSSRRTGCRSTLGMPGQRDQHTGCVGAHLVDNDLFDFMVFSLPDNDTYSHKHGPYAQVTSIANADRALERIMHAAGGVDAFLDDHAVIVMSDHSQTQVEDRLNLARLLDGLRVLGPTDGDPRTADVAACPGARSAMVYALDPERRDAVVADALGALRGVDGIDVLAHRAGDEAAVWTPRGELRFAPGGELTDLRGGRWSVEGEPAALGLDTGDGRVASRTYPDALARLWSALECPSAGDVLVSATPGFEFVDWGGADHVGGGSHGSLHRGDSLGTLLFCGTGPGSADERDQWTLADVAPRVLDHFALPSAAL